MKFNKSKALRELGDLLQAAIEASSAVVKNELLGDVALSLAEICDHDKCFEDIIEQFIDLAALARNG